MYNSTGGYNWNDNENWLVGDPCDNHWFGVTCDAANTTVRGLYLPSNNLNGSIPSELENLSNVTFLSLASNNLSGSIPSELGNLTNLLELRLHSNRLSGNIPSELVNLTHLSFMRLSRNKLSGDIPSELLQMISLWCNSSDFMYNALYTGDDTLRMFLDSIQLGDWESTQTIAPEDLVAGVLNPTSVQLDWTPITYTADTGGYEVYYSENPGGPYTYYDITADKTISSMVVDGLSPGSPYCFIIKTVTYPHALNQNTVYSEPSMEECTSSSDVPALGLIGFVVLICSMSLLLALRGKMVSP